VGGRAGVKPREVAPGSRPHIRRRPALSSSPGDGSEGGGGRTREEAGRGDVARCAPVGRGEWSGPDPPPSHFAPVVAPRHEVRGEWSGEVGPARLCPAARDGANVKERWGAVDLAGRRRRRRRRRERGGGGGGGRGRGRG
jgi:hypothetical protein